MLYALLALALSLVPLASAQDNSTDTVLAALKTAKVIPDVIASNFTPRFAIEVVFTDNTGSTFPVTAGVNLTMNQTANIPSFAILSNNTQIIGKPYLMAIVDPDAPSPAEDKNHTEFRHFLGADYISDNNTNGEFVMTNQSKTATLTDYFPPTPPATSPAHRYVVLCYLQNSTGITAPSGFNASDRNNFNISQFVSSVQGNNFTLLGATYFWVSANDTTGSVKPNSSNGGPVATAPAASGSAGAGSGSGSSDANKLGAVVAWTLVAVLTASGALLL